MTWGWKRVDLVSLRIGNILGRARQTGGWGLNTHGRQRFVGKSLCMQYTVLLTRNNFASVCTVTIYRGSVFRLGLVSLVLGCYPVDVNQVSLHADLLRLGLIIGNISPIGE